MRPLNACSALTEHIRPQHIVGEDSMDNEDSEPHKGETTATATLQALWSPGALWVLLSVDLVQ